jgi:hypothetical protein
LKTCQNLRRHVLLLELDWDVYLELLQSLLDVLEEQTGATEEENNDLDVLVKKKFKLDFDCE